MPFSQLTIPTCLLIADYVVLMVSANSEYKGVGRMLTIFTHAWQQAASLPGGVPGRLVAVFIGPGMLRLVPEVKKAVASLQPAPKNAGADLLAAIHVLDGTDNSTERLGWYAAADVHVLNSGRRGCLRNVHTQP